MLHGGIKNIAMENPGFTGWQVQDQFILYFEIPHLEALEFAQGFVVVTRDVIHFGAMREHRGDRLENLHVSRRKVTLAELPNINDIAIEHQRFRMDTLEVRHQLGCSRPIGPEVHIRNHN